MQHPDNVRRGDTVLSPLRAFVHERQLNQESIETQVGDMIANLLHLCDTLEINPLDAARLGLSGYLQEAVDPDGLSTTVVVAFQINGLDEILGLGTLRPTAPSPRVCNRPATTPASEGHAPC